MLEDESGQRKLVLDCEEIYCPAKEFGLSLIHDWETLKISEQERGIIKPMFHKKKFQIVLMRSRELGCW